MSPKDIKLLEYLYYAVPMADELREQLSDLLSRETPTGRKAVWMPRRKSAGNLAN